MAQAFLRTLGGRGFGREKRRKERRKLTTQRTKPLGNVESINYGLILCNLTEPMIACSILYRIGYFWRGKRKKTIVFYLFIYLFFSLVC